MALIDNPLLQAVGSKLGLSSIFDQAFQNASTKAGVSKLNPSESKGNPDFASMRFMQRMMGHGGNEGSAGKGAGVPVPMVNPESVNNPEAQSLLAQFGQSGQVQPDPNLFIHNPTAHPILGTLLDRALTGLAYTTGDPSNPGAIMHNVAAGLLAGNQARQQQVNGQLEAPFEQAARVSALQKDAASLQTMQDQQDELRARTTADNARADKDSRPPVPAEHNPEWAREQAYYDTFTNNAVAANGGKPLNDTQKQQAFDSATRQLAQDKASGRPLSPMGKAVSAAEEAYKAAHPDATSIPPEVYANLYGQVAGAKAKATAPYKKTSSSVPRDPLLNPRVQNLRGQVSTLNSQLKTATTSTNPIQDDQGHLLLFNSPARTKYIQDLQAQHKVASDQLNGLLYPNGSQPTGQTKAPAASSVSGPPASAFKNHPPGTILRGHESGTRWQLVNGQVTQVR